ncbi:unnamed protein product [Chondrus crispus]|nr:unnamed protein product [Chondrus crispus]CDF35629.1 unnamed protein product [Chondrus crispus]|eukprot:XP_005715448.1 unnamed protein product [Chondrus crispus]
MATATSRTAPSSSAATSRTTLLPPIRHLSLLLALLLAGVGHDKSVNSFH